ncbi:MAG TPA: YegS/Rv2252/BmrU family lipid kinase [Gemmatimonadaceae bacterium]|nr:YegS/Rv2252/BmrU family lipid kinase [Gemmatimonadaceae bacterium]
MRSTGGTDRKRLCLILHGARSELPALRHLVAWVREKGHTVDVRVTWEGGDAERFAREAAKATPPFDTVIAAGGDGTVNEVVNGLSGSDMAFGIIPLGTANDFARQAGIPDDVDHAMDVVLHHPAVRIDTAQANGRRYLNVSVGGVAAEVTAETPADAKESLGVLAYALSGLRKLTDLDPYTARFRGPDFDLQCKVLLFAVANGTHTGGGSRIAPKASLTDGLLDLCVVEALPRGDIGRMLLKVRRGEHLGEDGVHYVQLPEVVVSVRRPIVVNVDGETTEARRFVYAARPGDLRIHLPPRESDT